MLATEWEDVVCKIGHCLLFWFNLWRKRKDTQDRHWIRNWKIDHIVWTSVHLACQELDVVFSTTVLRLTTLPTKMEALIDNFGNQRMAEKTTYFHFWKTKKTSFLNFRQWWSSYQGMQSTVNSPLSSEDLDTSTRTALANGTFCYNSRSNPTKLKQTLGYG